MSSTKLAIPCISSELPTCNPNLMPFHINYTGPAAVSVFMRVDKTKPERIAEGPTPVIAEEPVSENTAVVDDMTVDTTGIGEGTSVEAPTKSDVIVASGLSDETVDVEMKIASSESQTPSLISRESTLVESQTSLSSGSTQISPTPPVIEDADKRFTSSFRGRSIHGLTIDLPPGYVGLVLQSDGNANTSAKPEEDEKNGKSKNKAKAAGKSKAKETPKANSRPRGRLTRSAAPKRPEVITVEDEDEEMAEATAAVDGSQELRENADPTPNDQPTRNLIPKAQFSSFTLWHADRPVEKTRDEYYRTVTEWIALSHEIHRTDLEF